MADGASRLERAAAAIGAAAILSLGVIGGVGVCSPGSGGGAAGTKDTARTAEVDTVSQRSIIEVQQANADEVGIAGPDFDVIERSQLVFGFRVDDVVREPPLGRELGIDDRVSVVGVVREEPTFRVCQHARFR